MDGLKEVEDNEHLGMDVGKSLLEAAEKGMNWALGRNKLLSGCVDAAH